MKLKKKFDCQVDINLESFVCMVSRIMVSAKDVHILILGICECFMLHDGVGWRIKVAELGMRILAWIYPWAQYSQGSW